MIRMIGTDTLHQLSSDVPSSKIWLYQQITNVQVKTTIIDGTGIAAQDITFIRHICDRVIQGQPVPVRYVIGGITGPFFSLIHDHLHQLVFIIVPVVRPDVHPVPSNVTEKSTMDNKE